MVCLLVDGNGYGNGYGNIAWLFVSSFVVDGGSVAVAVGGDSDIIVVCLFIC